MYDYVYNNSKSMYITVIFRSDHDITTVLFFTNNRNRLIIGL